MPYFEDAHHFAVHGSSFYDVAGDMNIMNKPSGVYLEDQE